MSIPDHSQTPTQLHPADLLPQQVHLETIEVDRPVTPLELAVARTLDRHVEAAKLGGVHEISDSDAGRIVGLLNRETGISKSELSYAVFTSIEEAKEHRALGMAASHEQSAESLPARSRAIEGVVIPSESRMATGEQDEEERYVMYVTPKQAYSLLRAYEQPTQDLKDDLKSDNKYSRSFAGVELNYNDIEIDENLPGRALYVAGSIRNLEHLSAIMPGTHQESKEYWRQQILDSYPELRPDWPGDMRGGEGKTPSQEILQLPDEKSVRLDHSLGI